MTARERLSGMGKSAAEMPQISRPAKGASFLQACPSGLRRKLFPCGPLFRSADGENGPMRLEENLTLEAAGVQRGPKRGVFDSLQSPNINKYDARQQK